MLRKTTYIQFLLAFSVVCSALQAQDPARFKKEIDDIIALTQSVNKENLILFTGSSSIRMWKDLATSFPHHNVVNAGFGGSEMSDLLYYTDKLIIPFKPVQVFIYEGDNDLNAGRSPEQIIASAEQILTKIREALPKTEVVFISPKPSLARWKLKEKYEAYNKHLKQWTSGKKKVRYADVWTPMLNSDGVVLDDIFIEDGLHLNPKGYGIWTDALRKYLKKPGK